MNKLQVFCIICITIIYISLYFAIWINSNTSLADKLMLTGVLLFIQSTISIVVYHTLFDN